MPPVPAGINVRKTARYAGEDCEPLHPDVDHSAGPQEAGVRDVQSKWPEFSPLQQRSHPGRG